MKTYRIIVSAAALVELVLISVLLMRANRQEERLVAASAAVVVQQEQILALRKKVYGDFLAETVDSDALMRISKATESPGIVFLWYEWMRAYGYGEKGADGTPKYFAPEDLFLLDIGALSNYARWVDEAYMARNSSKAIFRVFYNNFLKVPELNDRATFLMPIPDEYGETFGFNLPEQK